MSRGVDTSLRVLLVSDVRVVREGVRSILVRQWGLHVISTADTAHVRDQIARLRPDAILFDAAREGSVGHLRAIVDCAPSSKVVAFGVRETDPDLMALAAAGTAGYVSDCAAGADLVRALERVMCDEPPGSPPPTPGTCATPVGLSQRELQIVQLINRGLSNKAIGRELGIKPATVKNHVHNVCEKLRVHRRGEAAARYRALVRAPPLASALETSPAIEAS